MLARTMRCGESNRVTNTCSCTSTIGGGFATTRSSALRTPKLRSYVRKASSVRVRNMRPKRHTTGRATITRAQASEGRSMEEVLSDARRRRDDPRYWVRAQANDDIEAAVSCDCDEDSELTHYMTLPVSQFTLVEMPLGGRLERLEENLFALYVPRVAAFDFFVEPRLECYVTHETEPIPCVKVVSKSCELFGSPFVQSLNQCFDIHVEGRITWPPPDEGTNGDAAAPTLVSTTVIDFLFDPPAPLSFLGKAVLEVAANAILYTALSTLQRTFLKNLANDYNHWAKDGAYRMSRQEEPSLEDAR